MTRFSGFIPIQISNQNSASVEIAHEVKDSMAEFNWENLLKTFFKCDLTGMTIFL